MSADDAVCAAVAMPQDGGAGAVAEEDAGVAIGPIGDRGQFFRADDENGVVGVQVMNCCAISIAKRNPAQAAEMSRQAAFFAPIFV